MKIYKCSVCGYLYDESQEEVPFAELKEDWRCPVCRRDKNFFKPLEETDSVD
ncbi:rubredoxin [uncultured Clostridium sp.]|uniref:rubredoxin n=1 Tax=uncultured Clostridium sp. TaxID=59620 RepID=UPI0032164D23